MENKTQDVGQPRPRRWGSAGWAVAAKRDGRWLILPGRYETEAGANLTAEFAALGGKVLVAEVSAGPDPAQRSEAEDPSEAVRCSELLALAARWLEEAARCKETARRLEDFGQRIDAADIRARGDMLTNCSNQLRAEIGRAAEANAKLTDSPEETSS